MASPEMEAYLKRPLDERLRRLTRTPDDLATAIAGLDDEALSRRPAPKCWAAKEVLCHLRDIEEVFMLRFHMMLGTEEPTFLILGEMPPERERWGITGPIGMPLDPDRWAEERQYLRQDPETALRALRRRREESLYFLNQLTRPQWDRASVHVTLGRMTFVDWTALMAAHDDRHLDQLRRAVKGQP
jgi:hypothetical protein